MSTDDNPRLSIENTFVALKNGLPDTNQVSRSIWSYISSFTSQILSSTLTCSVTLSLNEIDLVENSENEQSARLALGNGILEYAADYYNDYVLYSHSPNRKGHIPYIFKALIMDNPEKIGESIQCQDGEN